MCNMLKKLFSEDRTRKVPIVDSVPVWATVIMCFVFLAIGLVFLIITIVWNLEGTVLESTNDVKNGTEVGNFFQTHATIQSDKSHFVGNNAFLRFQLRFRKKSDVKFRAVYLDDYSLCLNYVIAARENTKEGYFVITKTDNFLTTLYCTDRSQDCSPVILDYVETVSYYDYRVEASFCPKYTFVSAAVLDPWVDIQMEYYASPWLVVENVMSWLFFIGSIVFALFYFFYVFLKQEIREWSTEQLMIFVNLILFIFYTDPFYYIDDVYDGSGFTYVYKFLDGFATSNCVVWLFFTLVTLAFTVEMKIRKRTRYFWIAASIVSVVLYLMFLPVVLDFKYQRQLHIMFKIVVYIIIGFNCYLWPLMLLRFVILLRQKIMKSDKAIRRLPFVFTITLFMCFALLLSSIVRRGGITGALNAWYHQFMIAIILIFLAVNFLPTSKVYIDAEDVDALDNAAEERTPIMGKGSAADSDVLARGGDTGGSLPQDVVEDGPPLSVDDLPVLGGEDSDEDIVHGGV